MRRIPMLTSVLAVMTVALATTAFAAEPGAMATESGWFDMENCAFCKNLTEDPGLLPHTTWENHAIENGMMNIMTVDPAYAESAAKASAAMEKVGADIQAGRVNPMTLKMCGHCKEFGMLMMAGTHMETIKGEAAEVSLITSDDPATIKRIHALVERDNEEMALMMGGEHGHSH